MYIYIYIYIYTYITVFLGPEGEGQDAHAEHPERRVWSRRLGPRRLHSNARAQNTLFAFPCRRLRAWTAASGRSGARSLGV